MALLVTASPQSRCGAHGSWARAEAHHDEPPHGRVQDKKQLAKIRGGMCVCVCSVVLLLIVIVILSHLLQLANCEFGCGPILVPRLR